MITPHPAALSGSHIASPLPRHTHGVVLPTLAGTPDSSDHEIVQLDRIEFVAALDRAGGRRGGRDGEGMSNA